MADSRTLSYTAEQIDAILVAAQMHSNRNLLDNWDFRNPVNQRGVSGTISAAGYFIDRWKLVSGTVTITPNGLSLNGTIRQIREAAIGATVKASVGVYSGTATISYNDTTKYCDIVSSGGTIARCKLELGSISTLANDPSADYGEELRKCQRYCFNPTGNSDAWAVLGAGVAYAANATSIFLTTPTTMRVKPAAAGGSSGFVLRGNGQSTAVTSITCDLFAPGGVSLAATTSSSLGVNETYILSRDGTATGTLLLSADL